MIRAGCVAWDLGVRIASGTMPATEQGEARYNT